MKITTLISPTFCHQIVETKSNKKLDFQGQANSTEDQKHTSAVARIHYQRRKSKDIAAKAK